MATIILLSLPLQRTQQTTDTDWAASFYSDWCTWCLVSRESSSLSSGADPAFSKKGERRQLSRRKSQRCRGGGDVEADSILSILVSIFSGVLDLQGVKISVFPLTSLVIVRLQQCCRYQPVMMWSIARRTSDTMHADVPVLLTHVCCSI